ncbi:glycosyltransferase [Candidatus Bipolaricaulota bacterium]|nr:glycosyltransferase [Candidatus Bipolaricaulota bacterium]
MAGRLLSLDDYRPLVGDPVVDRIRDKARPLWGLHVTHVNSTYYGGGVATLLSSLTLLMNDVGIKTGWRVIQGSPDFFSVTKKFHNALQGGNVNLSPRKKQIYEDTVYENAVRNHLDHDVVVIHDPQPLPLVGHYRKRGPWIWRCHVDLTSPHPELWAYLIPFIERYDAVIVSMPEYRQELTTPQVVIPPAIDAFAVQNRELSPEEVEERLAHYGIPTDLPLVVQISRFDPWKDPQGVIEAFKLVREEVPATLVLLGNVATDDPEGEEVYRLLLDQREERIIILSRQDGALVNALQRRAAVVLQKSLREGFGLTVAEAMWKGTPVVGGKVGGIRHQIVDGVNGFLVSSVEEAAGRMVELLRDDDLRREMGTKARDTVREQFLMTGLLERYLDLFTAFEPNFRLRDMGN